MHHCSECGTDLLEDDRFCADCGSPVARLASAVDGETVDAATSVPVDKFQANTTAAFSPERPPSSEANIEELLGRLSDAVQQFTQGNISAETLGRIETELALKIAVARSRAEENETSSANLGQSTSSDPAPLLDSIENAHFNGGYDSSHGSQPTQQSDAPASTPTLRPPDPGQPPTLAPDDVAAPVGHPSSSTPSRNRLAILAVGALLVLAGVWLISSQRDGGNGSPTTPLINTQSVDVRDYSPAVRSNFLSACRGGGASDRQCLCMLEAIENEYTQSDFLLIEQEMTQTGQIPPFMTGVIARCS